MARARRQSVSREVAAWAAHLAERFLMCRDMGHAWRPYTAAWVPKDRQYARTLRCQRCKTDRVQRLSASGYVESTHYIYPDDYALPAGSGSYDTAARAAVHLASVQHMLTDDDSTEATA